MWFQGRSRQAIKELLAQSRIKLVYDRITQTRYTIFYFLLSGFTCVLLCALQGVILADNMQGVDVLTKVVDEAGPAPHITILKYGQLQVCESIPGQKDDGCMVLWLDDAPLVRRRSAKFLRRQTAPSEIDSESSDDEGVESSEDESSDDEAQSDDEDEEEDEEASVTTTTTVVNGVTSTISVTRTATSTSPSSTVTTTSTSVSISSTAAPSSTMTVSFPTPGPPAPPGGRTLGNGINLSQSANSPHTMQCIYALSWLEEVLHDGEREDVATLLFQIWTFGLGLVAILNESIPHLGAAFFSHVLAAAWSSTRIQGARSLASFYRQTIVRGPCANSDLLGNWWELRLAHTVPVVVFNILGVFTLGFLSWKLLCVYSSATFSRVGPTLSVQRVYRLVLLFSAGLQVASFFIAASVGLWIAKAAHGSFRALASHGNLYLGAFIVMLLATIPWMFFGWICVRKECKIRFSAFIGLSALMIGISSAMFSSNLYRTIFSSWRFFAVVTVTAFILLALTAFAGIACFFNFGRGLAHYLQVQQALAGSDFTPVYFPRDANASEFSSEKDYERYPESPNFNPTRGQDPYTGFHKSSEKDLEWNLPSRPASSVQYGPGVGTVASTTTPATPIITSPSPVLVAPPRLHDGLTAPRDRSNDPNLRSVWSADTPSSYSYPTPLPNFPSNPTSPALLSTPELIAQMPMPPHAGASSLQASSKVARNDVLSGLSGISSSFRSLAALPALPPIVTTTESFMVEKGSPATHRPTSVSSVSSSGSSPTRSLKASPFPATSVRAGLPARPNQGKSLSDVLQNPFADRHASVMSEGTVILEAPSRNLFVTNGLATPGSVSRA